MLCNSLQPRLRLKSRCLALTLKPYSKAGCKPCASTHAGCTAKLAVWAAHACCPSSPLAARCKGAEGSRAAQQGAAPGLAWQEYTHQTPPNLLGIYVSKTVSHQRSVHLRQSGSNRHGDTADYSLDSYFRATWAVQADR